MVELAERAAAHQSQPKPPSVVILISGSGRNLQVFLDAASAGHLNINIAAVISNRPEAKGLQRAEQAGVPTQVVDHQNYPDRDRFDAALAKAVDAYAPDVVLLAGFMRILTSDFVNRYVGRMLNVHPSLLPLYRGLNTYQRAMDDGATCHGVSVHFVTPELDGGPVVLQAVTEILPDDTVQSLEARVHQQELVIYPVVVQAMALGRLQLKDGQVTVDEQILTTPLQLHDPANSFQTHYTKGYENIFIQAFNEHVAASGCSTATS